MPLPEVHLVAGSSAEAIRLAPVAIALREQGRLLPVLVTGGGDPATVVRTFAAFGLLPEITLDPDDDEGMLVGRLDRIWAARTPAAVLVRGDGLGSLAGGLAAYWRRIPVVHLDAGRRSADLSVSTVAEAKRRLLAQLATVHLAAAPLDAMNLLDERVAGGDVLLTGSTMIDATRAVVGRRPAAERATRLVLATVDESRVGSMERISTAVRQIADRHRDVEVLMWGPSVSLGLNRVTITEPPSFPERARLLDAAYLVLTDDEDLQEEALAYGVPVLVLRDTTEQLEAVHAGCSRLVGEDPGLVVAEAAELLDSRVRRDAMTAGGNPYGDGLAAGRAAQATAALLGHGIFPEPMPGRSAAGISH
jgi:UDP-N-acetylglucosamine 2-epimerase (non-hydrolysing)